mgnify:CR=1 FL=1
MALTLDAFCVGCLHKDLDPLNPICDACSLNWTPPKPPPNYKTDRGNALDALRKFTDDGVEKKEEEKKADGS